MTVSDLTTGVTQRTLLAVLVGAIAAGWLGGASGAVGVLAGGALGLLSFRVLAARVQAACDAGPVPATRLMTNTVSAATTIRITPSAAASLALPAM